MIDIKGLSFSYSHKKPLFDHLELSLPSGNIYGLLGKNGAGKSSLLKIISGLLFPNSGTLQVNGFTPKERNPEFLREVYLLTEEFHVPAFTLVEYINLYSPFYPRFSKDQMKAYMDEFQLESGQKLDTLSYGQKKKFLLSFGLATDSNLLILDEPTNGLDIPSKSQFRKLVANAIHEERSIIISTHQVRDMENLIDPVIVLDQGEIVFNHSLEEVSKKLSMEKNTRETTGDDVIYVESSFGGNTVVRENRIGEETHMNLEILFNAVTANKERMYQLFKS